MKSAFLSLVLFVTIAFIYGCAGPSEAVKKSVPYSDLYNSNYAVAYGMNLKEKNLNPDEPHPEECPSCEGLCKSADVVSEECKKSCEENRKQHPVCADEALEKFKADQTRKEAEPKIQEFTQLSKIVTGEYDGLAKAKPDKKNEEKVNYIREKCKTGAQIIKYLQDKNLIEKVASPQPGQPKPPEPIENYFAFGDICSKVLEFDMQKEEYSAKNEGKELTQCADLAVVAKDDSHDKIVAPLEGAKYTNSEIKNGELVHRECESKVKGVNNALLVSVYGKPCADVCKKNIKRFEVCFSEAVKELGKAPAPWGVIADVCNSSAGKSKQKIESFIKKNKAKWAKMAQPTPAPPPPPLPPPPAPVQQPVAVPVPPTPPAAAPVPPVPPVVAPAQPTPPPAPMAQPPMSAPVAPAAPVAAPPQAPPVPAASPAPVPQPPPTPPVVTQPPIAPPPVAPVPQGGPQPDIAMFAANLANCGSDPACAENATAPLRGAPVSAPNMRLVEGAVYLPNPTGYLLEVELSSFVFDFRGQAKMPVRAFIYVPQGSPAGEKRYAPGVYNLTGRIDGNYFHQAFGVGANVGAFVPVIKVERGDDIK